LYFIVLWKEVNKREKVWEKDPLEKTSPEIIRGDMVRGGQVSHINRGATTAYCSSESSILIFE